MVKFYVEKKVEKKIQKDINKIFKKIGKNRKYFYSAKDLVLIEALLKDGFEIPSSLKFEDLRAKYSS